MNQQTKQLKISTQKTKKQKQNKETKNPNKQKLERIGFVSPSPCSSSLTESQGRNSRQAPVMGTGWL